MKLWCINGIKDVDEDAKGAFFLLFFEETIFVLYSRSQ